MNDLLFKGWQCPVIPFCTCLSDHSDLLIFNKLCYSLCWCWSPMSYNGLVHWVWLLSWTEKKHTAEMKEYERMRDSWKGFEFWLLSALLENLSGRNKCRVGETVLVHICLCVWPNTGLHRKSESQGCVNHGVGNFSALSSKSFFPFLFPPRSGFNFGVVTSAASSPTLPSLAASQGWLGRVCKMHLSSAKRMLTLPNSCGSCFMLPFYY